MHWITTKIGKHSSIGNSSQVNTVFINTKVVFDEINNCSRESDIVMTGGPVTRIVWLTTYSTILSKHLFEIIYLIKVNELLIIQGSTYLDKNQNTSFSPMDVIDSLAKHKQDLEVRLG